ncbi:MAG: ribosome hibernation-promoting factor, HPF/YfiA family [Gammaproteobacteria bacterium]
MNINYTGHHMKITDDIRNYAASKLERLNHHFDKIINVDVIFEIEKGNATPTQVAKATISAPHIRIHADAKSADLYAAIDGLVDKLDQQIRKHKGKMNNHHKD